MAAISLSLHICPRQETGPRLSDNDEVIITEDFWEDFHRIPILLRNQ